MMHLGDYPTSATVHFKWNTNAIAGESITRATNGSIRVYKGSSTTERSSANGITDTEDFDSLTGVHHCSIDLSDNTDAGFYAAGNEYQVVLQGATIDGKAINAVLAHFSIERSGGTLALLKDGTFGLSAIETLVDELESRLTATRAGYLDNLNGHTPQTGDSYARLGAPAGASVSADVAAIKSETASILTDTAEIGAAGAGLAAVPWNAAWDTEVQSEVQDAIEANHLDHLLAVTYDPASKPGAADALLNELVENDAGVSRFTANALEQGPGGGGSPTAADIADAVWEEALADHSGTAGSTAEQLAAAGAAGDPWATALPGSYTSGQAGKIVGDNLNATVGSRATQTSVDTIDDFLDTEIAAILAAVDTEVAAILTDTAELQTDWADGGRLDLILDARASQASVDATDGKVDDIKTKTDSLTFTTPGQVDATSVTVGDKTGYGLIANAVDATALATDAITEVINAIKAIPLAHPSGDPTTFEEILGVLLEFLKNKVSYDKLNDVMRLYKNDGSTPRFEFTMTDNSSEATRGAA